MKYFRPITNSHLLLSFGISSIKNVIIYNYFNYFLKGCKQQSSFYKFLYILLPLALSSCYSIRNVFNEKPEVGFFEKGGTGNVSGGIAIKENIMSGNLSVSYSSIENVIIGASLHTYSNSMFNDSGSSDLYFRGKEALFSGKKISAFVGYYKNFGALKKKYSEFRFGIGGESDKLKTYRRLYYNLKVSEDQYYYNATSFYFQYGIGARKKYTAIASGVKVQYHLLNQNIPVGILEEDAKDYKVANSILTINPFLILNFDVKEIGTQCSIGASFDPFREQILPNIGLSLLYHFKTKGKLKNGL